MLYLVRHGRPQIERSRPAHQWELDPAAYDEIWALRTSGRLPDHAAWFSSPEPKALGILAAYGDDDVVLVGHGTAWTVLAAALTATEPDLDRWRALQMPDLVIVERLRST